MSNLKLKELVATNLTGLTEFIKILAIHNGNYKPERLWKVEQNGEKLAIRKGYKGEQINDFAILMGGEISNSYVPLYELGYFFQALFLAAIGSCVIKKGWLGKYRLLKDRELLDKIIVADLQSLDAQTIENNLKSPIITIVSTLDTDVTAIRYNHHQLWGLVPEVLDSYGGNIKAEYLGITPIDESLKDQYWIEQDLQITQKILGLGYDLPQSKALLMYQIFGLVCRDLGINMADIPVFFHLSPKEEIMQAGNTFSFLDVLSAVNSPDKKHIYRLLTKQDNPWAISTSCPKCGQASKTIIYTKIMDETRTIRISCKQRVYDFKNERGDAVSSHGCGNVSYLEIPRGTKKLFEFIQNHDITIHFPTRSTIYTLLDSSVTRSAWSQAI